MTIRRPKPAPLSNPPAAGDVSSPINMNISPSGAITVPPAFNVVTHENINNPFFVTGLTQTKAFTPQFNNPASGVVKIACQYRVRLASTAVGVLTLLPILTNVTLGVNVASVATPLLFVDNTRSWDLTFYFDALSTVANCTGTSWAFSILPNVTFGNAALDNILYPQSQCILTG